MMDLFTGDISKNWIFKILEHCKKYNNRYLFQSKNPHNFYRWENIFPEITYLGTTIETNRAYPQMGNTPSPIDRATVMNHHSYYFPIVLTIEPIMDFDLDEMLGLIYMCNPEWVNIGADSKGHNLPEPSKKKIQSLIDGIKCDLIDIEVKLKGNLKRLMK